MTAERFCINDACARTIAGTGADWHPYKYHAVNGGVLVTGVVAPLTTRGKNKGRPNWNKKDKSTEQTVFVSDDYRVKFETEWSKSTGKCVKCVGTGTVFARWTKVSGTEYKTCLKCLGTGAASNT